MIPLLHKGLKKEIWGLILHRWNVLLRLTQVKNSMQGLAKSVGYRICIFMDQFQRARLGFFTVSPLFQEDRMILPIYKILLVIIILQLNGFFFFYVGKAWLKNINILNQDEKFKSSFSFWGVRKKVLLVNIKFIFGSFGNIMFFMWSVFKIMYRPYLREKKIKNLCQRKNVTGPKKII